jgi:hypothetical protein
MGNTSHSETINKFHIKSEGWITNSSLLQSVLQAQGLNASTAQLEMSTLR